MYLSSCTYDNVDPDHMLSTSCSSEADVEKPRQLWALFVWSVGVYFHWLTLTMMLLYQNTQKRLYFPPEENI